MQSETQPVRRGDPPRTDAGPNKRQGMIARDTTLGEFAGESLEWEGEFRLVSCSRALNPSGLYGMDYSLNPYGGCEHGCIYCYAVGHTHSDPASWRVVRVKRNIADRLSRELPYAEGTVGVGTATDPYQAAEGRFRLTRSCLEILASKDRDVRILTKSDLVLRDADLISEMGATVGISVSGLDDRISRMTEPGAPLPSARLAAMAELSDRGVRVFAMVAPLMSSSEDRAEELADAIWDAGVRSIGCSGLNTRSMVPEGLERLERMGIRQSPEAVSRFRRRCAQLGLDGPPADRDMHEL